MKIVRFVPPDARDALWGVLDGDSVRELAAAPYAGIAYGKAEHRLAAVRLAAPAVPSKIRTFSNRTAPAGRSCASATGATASARTTARATPSR